MSNNSGDKKAFPEAGYASMPVMYPDELCLVGGKDHITDKRQQGPLDTDQPDRPDHLYRPNRLTNEFKPGFVESIDMHGVLQAIRVVKRDNVPAVEYGQHRVRGARLVNYLRRQECGQLNGKSDREADEICRKLNKPLRKLKCESKHDTSVANSISRILIENHMRHDDDIDTTLALVRQQLDDSEGNYKLVARDLGVDEQTVRNLMRYDEAAVPQVKEAFKAGRLKLTHAAILARMPAEEQPKALTELLSAPNPTVRRAAKLARKDKGVGANPFHGKKELAEFGEFLKKEGGSSAFMDGVRAMINLQTTGKSGDERLTKIFKASEWGTPKKPAKDDKEE